MAYYNNVHIDEIINAAHAVAEYFSDKNVGFCNALFETWLHPQFEDALRHLHSDNELRTCPFFINFINDLAALEYLIAFEALSERFDGEDMYYAVKAFKGFTPLSHKDTEILEQEVIDYIDANPEKQERALKKLLSYDESPEADEYIGVNLMKDEQDYEKRYGEPHQQLKAKIVKTGTYSFNYSPVTKTRYAWFSSKYSFAALESMYPDHAFVEMRIGFDEKYLRPNLKAKMRLERIERDTALLREKTRKAKRPAVKPPRR